MRACAQSLCLFLVCVAGLTAGAANRYVALGNPGAAAPYTNWASAAATIQPAVDVAQAGETVWVSNGVYTTGGAEAAGLMSRVAVTSAVTVRSVNGPGTVALVGQMGFGGQAGDAVRGAYLAEGAVLDGVTIRGGYSQGWDFHGAGVFCEGPGAVLTNCVVADNTGGGVLKGTLYDCVLSNNTSGGSTASGAGARESTLYRCLLMDNEAQSGSGGGVAMCVLSNCVLKRNDAFMDGGGAHASTLQSCLVISNHASLGGGVANSTVSNCHLVANTATGGGGAKDSVVTHSVLSNNYAGAAGGGVQGGTSAYCRIVNNESGLGGGASSLGSLSTKLYNCVITGNRGSQGGGVHDADLYHCTVVDNEANAYGGGALNARAYNSIIYFNRSPNDPDSDDQYQLIASYTCTRPMPGWGGGGNITNAPLLGGPDNLHLLPGSPCIDAGSNVWATWALDLDGEARTNGLLVDMGVDEFSVTASGSPAAAIFAPWGTRVVAGYPLPLEAAIPLRLPGTALSWSFGDGAGTNEDVAVRHAWATPGLYDVVLAVTNLGGSSAATVSVEVVNLAAGTRYARTNGHDAADGSTWATAKATLQGAVDAVDAVGGLVLASNGVYASGSTVVDDALSNRVVIKVATTVRSVNGPAVTEIRGKFDPTPGGLGPAALRGVYLKEEARLIGFTVTSGATTMVAGPAGSGAGLFAAGPGAGASNCVLTRNVAFHQGGGSWSGRLEQCTIQGNRAQEGAGCFAGVLFHSLLAGNVATSAGGGTCYAELNNCLLYSNRAHQGGAAFGGRLVHCTVQGNTAVDRGGGVYAGEVLNSILYYNLANSSLNAFGGSLSYCCTHPLPVAGSGNFTNSPGTSGLHDPRLPLGSACIDAGSALPALWAKDWHGEPRTNGVAVDVGADEYWPAGLTGLLTCAIATPNGTAVVAGAPLALQAQLSGTPLFFTWSMGDGVELTNVQQLAHSWSAPGSYSVVLYAENLDGSAAATVSVQVVDQLAAARYVAPVGNDGQPGTNWATAKATIQAAVGVTIPGGTVWVSNGVYMTGGAEAAGLMTRVAVTNPVTVRSVNGPGSAMIVGQPGSFGQWNDAYRGVYLIEGAVLDGFTVSNGFSDLNGYGAGVFGAGPGAVLTNCLLTANYGGGAYGVTLRACVLSNNVSVYTTAGGGGARQCVLLGCLLVGNTADVGGGGAADSVLSNCVVKANGGVTGSLGGGGAANSTLYDCLVISNQAASRGGGVGSCVARGCTLQGNTAGVGGGAHGSQLEHCLVTNNHASSSGGGVADGTSRYCRIVNNWSGSTGGGGAAFLEQAPRLENCVVAGNMSGNGGGVSGMHMYHCTVVDNEANAFGGGLNAGRAYNSIVYFNRAPNEPASDNFETVLCDHTCTFPVPSGGGLNFTNDPGLLDLLAGNLRLAAGSPCLDAGLDSYATWSADLDGLARTNGASVDLGAYERPSVSCAYDFSPASASYGSGGATGDVMATATVYCRWDVTSSVPWLTVGNLSGAGGQFLAGPSAGRGYGAGSVVYLVASNHQPFSRQALLQVGPSNVVVYQAGNPNLPIVPEWLAGHGLATDGSADFGDPDSDGLSTRQEWVAGTDPTNSTSALRFCGPTNEVPPGASITWPSVSGRLYTVLRSLDLSSEPFVPVAEHLPGTGGIMIYTDPAEPPQAAYRIEVE